MNLSNDITLRQAIDQHRAMEDPTGKVTEAMSETSLQVFDMHDAVHLIFGCGTSLKDEIAAHAWMAFGTNAPIAEMHKAVANQEHKNTLSGIGHLKLLGTWLTMLPRLFSIFIKTRKMPKKLDYYNLDVLLEKSIADIRMAHGIRLF